MDISQIIALLIGAVLLVETVVLLLKTENIILTLISFSGVVLEIIALALKEYTALKEYWIYAISILGLVPSIAALVIWYQDDQKARKLLADADALRREIDKSNKDLMETDKILEHSSEELRNIKHKVDDYESI
ncbi:MAG TPA: hypothetical protein EYP22_08755 [Methanosarcinales archaeon]|nr:hypothetical protein [Methanosarcinales archaeon]